MGFMMQRFVIVDGQKINLDLVDQSDIKNGNIKPQPLVFVDKIKLTHGLEQKTATVIFVEAEELFDYNGSRRLDLKPRFFKFWDEDKYSLVYHPHGEVYVEFQLNPIIERGDDGVDYIPYWHRVRYYPHWKPELRMAQFALADEYENIYFEGEQFPCLYEDVLQILQGCYEIEWEQPSRPAHILAYEKARADKKIDSGDVHTL
jgi:hypothetical protein